MFAAALLLTVKMVEATSRMDKQVCTIQIIENCTAWGGGEQKPIATLSNTTVFHRQNIEQKEAKHHRVCSVHFHLY